MKQINKQTNVNSVLVGPTAQQSLLVLSSCLKAVQGTQYHKHNIQVVMANKR